MKTKKEEIQMELRKLVKDQTPLQVFAGTVVAVDENQFTCDVDPVDGSATYHDVRLKATIDGDNEGIITIPVVGSSVLVGMIDNNHTFKYVALFGEIKSYLINTKGNGTLEINKDGILKLNGDTFGGLVKVEEVLEKINALEKFCNTLLTTIESVIVPLAPSGTYPLAPVFANINPLVTTKKSDLENENVNHG